LTEMYRQGREIGFRIRQNSRGIGYKTAFQPFVSKEDATLTTVETEADLRDSARFHVKLIMGTQHAMIVDTKFKPLTRSMELPLDESVSESNFREIFKEIMEALHLSGNMASDESALCITFPEGTTQVAVPLPEGVN